MKPNCFLFNGFGKWFFVLLKKEKGRWAMEYKINEMQTRWSRKDLNKRRNNLCSSRCRSPNNIVHIQRFNDLMYRTSTPHFDSFYCQLIRFLLCVNCTKFQRNFSPSTSLHLRQWLCIDCKSMARLRLCFTT